MAYRRHPGIGNRISIMVGERFADGVPGVSVMSSAADDPVERRVRPVADEADR